MSQQDRSYILGCLQCGSAAGSVVLILFSAGRMSFCIDDGLDKESNFPPRHYYNSPSCAKIHATIFCATYSIQDKSLATEFKKNHGSGRPNACCRSKAHLGAMVGPPIGLSSQRPQPLSSPVIVSMLNGTLQSTSYIYIYAIYTPCGIRFGGLRWTVQHGKTLCRDEVWFPNRMMAITSLYDLPMLVRASPKT